MNKAIGILLITFIFSGVNLSIGQKHTVKISKEVKLDNKTFFAHHLHSDETGHYLRFDKHKRRFSGGDDTPVIKKFDNDFNEIFSKEYKASKDDIFDLGIKYIKGKFVWIYYFKNKDKKTIDVFASSILKSGKTTKPIKFASFKYKRKNDLPDFFWEVSQDTSKIMFVAEYDDNKKKKNYQAYVCTLDKNFEKQWDKTIKMNYSQKKIKTWSWELTNSNEIYFIGKVYDNEKEKESNKSEERFKIPAYKITIFNISESENELKHIDLDVNSFTRGLILEADKDSNILVAGIYGDSKGGAIIGTYYAKILDNDKSVAFKNKRKFTSREIESFGKKYTRKERKTKNMGLNGQFELTDLIIFDNGDFNVVMEENYITTVTHKNHTTYYYNSNLIIVANVNIDGKVKSISVIPKRQTFAKYDFPTSYSAMTTDDTAYFLYNDNNKNFKKRITDPDKYKRLINPKKCVAVLAHFEDGKLKRKQLFDRTDLKTTLLAKKSKQINDDQMIFFTWRGKFFGKGTFRFGTVNIK